MIFQNPVSGIPVYQVKTPFLVSGLSIWLYIQYVSLNTQGRDTYWAFYLTVESKL